MRGKVEVIMNEIVFEKRRNNQHLTKQNDSVLNSEYIDALSNTAEICGRGKNIFSENIKTMN